MDHIQPVAFGVLKFDLHLDRCSFRRLIADIRIIPVHDLDIEHANIIDTPFAQSQSILCALHKLVISHALSLLVRKQFGHSKTGILRDTGIRTADHGHFVVISVTGKNGFLDGSPHQAVHGEALGFEGNIADPDRALLIRPVDIHPVFAEKLRMKVSLLIRREMDKAKSLGTLHGDRLVV